MDLDEVKLKMAKAVDFVKQDLATIRTGRASTSLVENIIINAYGGTTKLKVVELAQVAVPDSQSITVTPYDQSIIGDIRRDIEAANVGFNPVIDNQVIRINVPPLTAERRMEYVKMLHRRLEDGRVKVRQVRHEVMSEYKRSAEEGNLNEDERERQEDELQKLTDEMMERIEEIGKAKEEELVTI
ncbi:ribosome recycling factor [Candidatus Amesbacteria bacterium RIFCSPHIGHO2_01_FULL_47_34]|uniref:Ribosome-recycling factor n=2 Tax=Candidatus Amesiibacteriota TaxID=1752730 RepID=A0A1F4ZUF9_9BACT|nr:MAG: ribosome recycling factor [Candidatus Amesbacteria bacterium RIFCSPLOWO2_01_FULL_47_33]OGD00814.1 MAG: ribosome recycling factor [Candidatus Amesbacteria bacterium RIFCSPHIGHO2_01_FULL_47_34]OGD09995.1 MAG: ribosome recycling factor [Candidatus Amesbacteria bacterium RIFOXYB1_FULL_47_9]